MFSWCKNTFPTTCVCMCDYVNTVKWWERRLEKERITNTNAQLEYQFKEKETFMQLLVFTVSHQHHFYLRWVSTSVTSFTVLLFFCWYLAYEYHTPPAVLITNPDTFNAWTWTPPSKKKPKVWRNNKKQT